MSSFVDQCLKGHALLDEIDDFIDVWHESDSNLELHDFLGMSNAEFSAWVSDSSVLPFIIKARKEDVSFQEIIAQRVSHVAARAENLDKMEELENWLKDSGHIE